MICPFKSGSFFGEPDCEKENCALWCEGENECSIKVLALEAIKRGEKQ